MCARPGIFCARFFLARIIVFFRRSCRREPRSGPSHTQSFLPSVLDRSNGGCLDCTRLRPVQSRFPALESSLPPISPGPAPFPILKLACPIPERTSSSLNRKGGASVAHASRAIEPPLQLRIPHHGCHAEALPPPLPTRSGAFPIPGLCASLRTAPPCLAARGGGVRCCTLQPVHHGHSSREPPPTHALLHSPPYTHPRGDLGVKNTTGVFARP